MVESKVKDIENVSYCRVMLPKLCLGGRAKTGGVMAPFNSPVTQSTTNAISLAFPASVNLSNAK